MSDINEFNVHLKKHIITYNCIVCGYQNSSSSNMKHHMKIHLAEPAPLNGHTLLNKVCNLCNKYFESVSELNKHMQSHKNVNIFACSECDFIDPCRDNLKEHMMKHLGENHIAFYMMEENMMK